MFLKTKKGELSMQYTVIFILLLLVLVALLIYSGILREQGTNLLQKALDLIIIQ